ncbi:hypothetical protein SAMN00120144_2935 [Hymenobacter roseosalivarius DSM 11622]|uniref:SGNH hydrolase-type esterase domain-containing protein n=1 Tax=Hymenobacter roseosalivarius DSM 11622 TaxID=645990 RepID=A0A1W1VU04_9BACT|nr:hypothetical protein [Hymenobacter roseosalivarius]SMB96835.1 hypothetical protein SAMN00120144_2935 [Hymenobacter roseosalivarius DSM 11622]
MVVKALMVMGVIFALYAVFIAQVKPYWSISHHKEQQDNQIKAEKYLYDYRQEHGVVVGSSLSSHLGNLPGIYNLALDGLSSLDGLAIVMKQKSPPRTVLIEINFIDREENTSFTGLVNNPVLKPAKRLFMSMRADKQPLSVVVEQLQMTLDRLRAPFIIPDPAVPGSATSAQQASRYTELLTKQLERYAQAPAPGVFEQQLGKLRQAVSLLEQQGARVVFFEMPVDCRLDDSPRAKAVRVAFRQYFPQATYSYVPRPACAAYQTADGIHLDAQSVTKYSYFLQEQLAKHKR